jgi:hypothetical protein
MKSKPKGTVRLVGAFVAGMVITPALFGWASARSKIHPEADPGKQVVVPNTINPSITDEDIAML